MANIYGKEKDPLGIDSNGYYTTGLLEYCKEYIPDIAESLRFDGAGFAYLNKWVYFDGKAHELKGGERTYVRTVQFDDINGVTICLSSDKHFAKDSCIREGHLELTYWGSNLSKGDCEDNYLRDLYEKKSELWKRLNEQGFFFRSKDGFDANPLMEVFFDAIKQERIFREKEDHARSMWLSSLEKCNQNQ